MPRAAKQDAADMIDDAAEPSLGDVLAAIQRLSGRMDDIEDRVAEQGRAIPRMVPIASGDISKPRPNLAELQREGQMADGGRTLPTTPSRAGILLVHQLFEAGDYVRIRPDSERAQRMAASGRETSNLVGQVLALHYIDKRGVPKYRIRFPGITQARGDGFREDEIEPA